MQDKQKMKIISSSKTLNDASSDIYWQNTELQYSKSLGSVANGASMECCTLSLSSPKPTILNPVVKSGMLCHELTANISAKLWV